MTKYEVLRQHLGDKMYMPGDQREAVRGDVQHLINNGVLTEKSEQKPANKAEQKPANKADPLDHDRDGRKGGVKKVED